MTRDHSYRWGHSELAVDFDFGAADGFEAGVGAEAGAGARTDQDGDTPRLVRVARPGDPETEPEPEPETSRAAADAALPLVELTLFGDGTGWSGPRFGGTALGQRLRYRAHHATFGDGWHRLTVELADPASGLTVFAEYASPDAVSVLRSRVRLRNDGPAPVTVRSVSSLLLGGLPSPDDLRVFRARNDWVAECRWYDEPLRATVPDIGRELYGHDSRAAVRLAGRGSWPTDGHLAMGAFTHEADGRGWLWQIESAASWQWEAGEAGRRTCLTLSGPGADEHQWRQVLGPGEEFTGEWAALALGEGFDGALAALTSYRRLVRRPHPDHEQLPVIFNDYMNTLLGDPTAEKLLPLIDAAARAGAEYFCVDAGWYDDEAGGWWDSVGAWLPSERRFPGGGLRAVLDRIRDRGMVPGLWLEAEVVGVRSPVARELPDEAFLRHEGGVRVTEQGRHQLDLTHPAARDHLDRTVDRIVGEWGVGYLKLDYNITTSVPGLLDHSRAWLAWLGSVLDRYPALVIENCASGGMRMDGASLAVTQLQSTSDQQDPLRYPPIAAAAPTAVPPEQGAVWAYPQPAFTDAEIGFTLGSALLGRIHLSGHLDKMTESQLSLVRGALTVYKAIRGDLRTALPFWPLGLPGWSDEWLALGMRAPVTGMGAVSGATYLSVWRRGGGSEQVLPVRHLAGRKDVRVEVLHPAAARASAGAVEWDGEAVRVVMPGEPGVLLVRLITER
ncbi:glycoside hydrolase family 36 protein [Streptomyces sp. NBC_00878]|uniref:glycoside hydrolase family 36 protein n=1 Tax=Streptomyces sp. NBC_00878 TaxID=2975854 RepID=UPI002257B91B|nr:glycoside hydrolase family 36 protein [Streptomyces sp. NBC_00878]MCX4908882.1 alpha-galactosidase [Streptomyces sp. NBC_00878]